MNEGWASYWHQRILREMDLTSDEAIEFNAGVVQPSKQALIHTTSVLKCLKILKNVQQPDRRNETTGVKPGSGRENV